MSIKSAHITNDLNKSDNKLSFKFNNTIEYEYNILKDSMLIGASEPVGVVKGESLSVLKKGLIDGYSLKKVYTEDVTVEVYADADSNSFYERTFVIDYYIQTRDAGVKPPYIQVPEEDNAGDTGTNDGGGSSSSGSSYTITRPEEDTNRISIRQPAQFTLSEFTL